MVKGSHLVVDKLYDHDRCYIFQNADGRICFAIPYEQNYTLIGTTDEDHKGDPGKPADLGRRDRLSACRRERVFPEAGDARQCALGLFRHPPAL